MKKIRVEATFHPLGLFVQINPFTGEVMEMSLVAQSEYGNAINRHEQWWRDVPEEWRRAAQVLVDRAIEDLLQEEDGGSN